VTQAGPSRLVVDLFLCSPGRTTIGGVGNRSSPIIVGRDVELARIEQGLEVAALGRPVLVLVRGEAGIGKSRLVREGIEGGRGGGAAGPPRAWPGPRGGGVPALPLLVGVGWRPPRAPP